MERREFLKLTLGFTAAAGAIVAAATAAQASPMLPPTELKPSDVQPKPGETAAQPPQQAKVEPVVQDELNAGEVGDTDISSQYWRRRRRRFYRRFYRRRRRFWRRRRVIYY